MTTHFCYLAFHPFMTVHLTKDTGKIPEVIVRLLGWQSSIVRFNNDKLINQEQELPHVKVITQVPKKFWRIDLNVVWFLIKQAKQIDVLLLYHFDLNTHFYGLLYKLVNQNGFLWNKLDLNEDIIRDFSMTMKLRKPINRIVYQNIIHAFFRKVDLISSESIGNANAFCVQFPEAVKKLVYFPNGIDPVAMPEIENVIRENIILTVARLGTWEKGTDILLEAFARSKVWPNWKLVLVGRVEENFKPWIENFKNTYPDVWNSVKWINHLDSRKELARWYQSAKVFCLPSRFESFSMALLESGYYGCACIASDFASAFDILDHGNCGVIFPRGQTEELIKHIEDLCQDQEHIQEMGIRVQKHIRSSFNYEKIIHDWYGEYERRQKNIPLY